MAIDDINGYEFSKTTKTAVILTSNRILHFLELGKSIINSISEVTTYKLIIVGKSEHLLYQTSKGNLIIQDLNSSRKHVYNDVIEWIQLKDGIVLKFKLSNEIMVSYIGLSTFKQHEIGRYFNVYNLVTDAHKQRLAFITLTEDGGQRIIAFHNEMKTPSNIINLRFNKQLSVIEKFSTDGSLLFVRLMPDTLNRKKTGNLTIWSYSDEKLQSQLRKEKNIQLPLAVIKIPSGDLIRIEGENEQAGWINESVEYLLHITKQEGDGYEAQWNKKGVRKHCLYDIRKNEMTQINFFPISLSSNGDYLLAIDGNRPDTNCIIVYNRRTKLQKILISAKDNDLSNDHSLPHNDHEHYSFVGWRGNVAYFQDRYDLWKIDVSISDKLRSVTNGYGRMHNISFRLAQRVGDVDIPKIGYLLAFNNLNLFTGYFFLQKEGANPIELVLDKRYFNTPGLFLTYGFFPLKAENAKVWIVSAESSSESVNYYTTTDFKVFKPLSDVHPEKNFNWISSEVVNFKTLNGKDCQAILYKPEDFDNTRKYPVIINYYERLSYFNNYLYPELSSSNINVPWFTSRGYIVCRTDINYVKGQTGQSALNAVEGLAVHLSKFSFVDSSAFAIQGHSFGGYETNYIVTHSNRFAAAVSAAGYSDLISDVNSVRLQYGGNYQANRAEVGQGRLGYSLWQRPDIYINNSPIFFADKISTPLLMMHNPNDDAVNISQGLEFFIALRRLAKKVWLLEYNDEGHSLNKVENKLDYTRKIEEFFGHYLKGESMPGWMKPRSY
ncbi:MAG: prolyl oligopeptidase family serine peptidase [Bacteroidota bacterium]